ncbi:helix-turn-helix domain-containing protein [bacterium]|nr:helix-turn-helix domain-containing protein [bacterium]
MLQSYIPFLPKGAKPINNHVAIYRHDGEIEFFTASGPIYACRESDAYGIRLAQGIIVSQMRTTPAELSRALGINRSTVYRNVKTYEKEGPEGLIIDKKSNRGAYKLNGKTKGEVQRLLNKGFSLKAAAKQAGITEGCIRYAIRQGAILGKNQQDAKPQSQQSLQTASDRSTEDSDCAIGIGAKRESERVLASVGKLIEAKPSFVPSEAVQHAGVLLTLPVLARLGLLDAGKNAYGALHKGFYGLQSVLLTLSFMALLRIKTPEQLKGCNPGELGIILGLDRAPEVKTLRRKLKEMGLRQRAGDFLSSLSERWADQDRNQIGFAYIDGHVRAYNGRKHRLPKTHVARRRLCMPATTDFWVNDASCEPLFFVTAEANDSLLSMLETEIVPELKKLAGEGNRVTLVFDREGWSPKSFSRWYRSGVDVITYRKGRYDPWPEGCFREVGSQIRGKAVKYLLGERSNKIKEGFWLREVRRLCDNGHQTSIVTTRQDIDCEQIARRMFFRWNQENFFRYMREEYALDHLVTNSVEPADVKRLVPNPDKKEKRKRVNGLKRELEKLKRDYGDNAIQNDGTRRRTMRGFNIANSGQKKKILEFESQVEREGIELKTIPDRIAVKQLLAEHEIVRLETERKMLTDGVKMLCYRAETYLMNQVAPFFPRNDDEGRAFLNSVFQQPADIIPDPDGRQLAVKFHTMSTPRANSTLQQLCDMINRESYVYPGTRRKLVFTAT